MPSFVYLGQVNHITKQYLRLWQSVNIKTSTRSECQFSKYDIPSFHIKIGPYKRERFRQFIRIFKQLLIILRLRQCKIGRSLFSRIIISF